jgi:hypothetical protein
MTGRQGFSGLKLVSLAFNPISFRCTFATQWESLGIKGPLALQFPGFFFFKKWHKFCIFSS